jgi:hypothetical protein
MPDDLQRHAEEHPHGPVHADVRYERQDARLKYVVWFSVIFVAVLVAGHITLFVLFTGIRNAQEAAEQKADRLPPIARGNRPEFPEHLQVIREQTGAPPLQTNDRQEMKELRDAEDAVLNSYGWSDPAKGTVHIPINEALKLIADPQFAKAHGIIARVVKESK